mgnify:CR=1 FL=1
MTQLTLDLNDAEARVRQYIPRLTMSENLYVSRSSWTNKVYVGVRHFDGTEADTKYLFDITEAAARKLVGLGLVEDRSLATEFS